MTLERLLHYCYSKGFGYPYSSAWARMHTVLIQETGGGNCTFPRLCNPLILGGSIAPPEDKILRFFTQIYWAYRNGGFEKIERFILRLKDSDWVGGEYLNADLYEYHHSYYLNKIKKEYASWLGVMPYPEIRPYTLDELFPGDRLDRLDRRARRYEERLNRQVDNESIVSIGPGGKNKDDIRWDEQHISGMRNIKKERKWHY